MHEKLTELSSQLKEKFKDKIEEIIVFGSYARGDFNEDSDVDLLIVVNDNEIEEDVRKVVYSFIPIIRRLISVKIIDKGTFENMKRMKFSLVLSIEKEGIKIG